MQKIKFLNAVKLRASAVRLSRGIATLFVALLLVAVPTAAHADGLSDFMPSGPDFETLGPVAPVVVGFFAIILALIGVFGVVAALLAGLKFGIGAMTNNERKTSEAVDQLKKAGIAIGISSAGAAAMVILLNIIIAVVGVF
jgi:hypothetical protein